MTMKNNAKTKIGNIFIICGILLIAAALVLLVHNINVDMSAGDGAGEIVRQLDDSIPSQPENGDEDTTGMPVSKEIDTDRDMPEVEIGGNSYVGILDIPAIDLSMPVMSEWSYPNLKIAPCRYYGSVYSKDMVIAGHNYSSFFGELKDLEAGDKVTFTDAEGNEFNYEVDEIDLLSPWQVDEMDSGEYPLTIFTCNYSGRQRVTVRCKEV
jgi:sortase A